jgi:hypothetical protein
MKFSAFAGVLASAVLAGNSAFAADGLDHQLSSASTATPGRAASKMVLVQSATQSGSERSIIIVSGKNAKSASSPGSKVMLNPQPLPPRIKETTAIRSNTSNVMLNPQPLPPKVR